MSEMKDKGIRILNDFLNNKQVIIYHYSQNLSFKFEIFEDKNNLKIMKQNLNKNNYQNCFFSGFK